MAKKKIVKKTAKRTKTADRVVAAVEFVQGADGYIQVRTTHTDDCPHQTAFAANKAADLLFRECRKNGAVAINLGGRVVLAEPATRDELPLIGRNMVNALTGR